MIMAKGCRDTFKMTYDGILIQFSVFANYGHDKSHPGTWAFGYAIHKEHTGVFAAWTFPGCSNVHHFLQGV